MAAEGDALLHRMEKALGQKVEAQEYVCALTDEPMDTDRLCLLNIQPNTI